MVMGGSLKKLNRVWCKQSEYCAGDYEPYKDTVYHSPRQVVTLCGTKFVVPEKAYGNFKGRFMHI